MAIEDDRGYSLLHMAAFKRFSNDFESLLCAQIKKQGVEDGEFLSYLNK